MRLSRAAGSREHLVSQPFYRSDRQQRALVVVGIGGVAGVLAQVTVAGIPAERTLLLGFSQGACLTLEFAARNARRYAGVVGLMRICPPGNNVDFALQSELQLQHSPMTCVSAAKGRMLTSCPFNVALNLSTAASDFSGNPPVQSTNTHLLTSPSQPWTSPHR